ncbi:MAG: DUF937 domain-containing protein [Candidatus Aegiribacteria sp.]|nr:DUF937 domain-containing protein [Candidatus Aegiribacteria sp.]
MSLLSDVVSAGKGVLVKELAKLVGLSDDQAISALSLLVPALSKGLDRNTADRNGLESLLSVVRSGNHREYVDNPETLSSSETLADGNAILGHIFGNKDVSREVAGFVSSKTGIDTETIKKMLPAVAAATLGTIEKEDEGTAVSADDGNFLKELLRTDRVSGLDAILSLARKLF